MLALYAVGLRNGTMSVRLSVCLSVYLPIYRPLQAGVDSMLCVVC